MLDDVMAHEMGHAVHAEMSKSQGFLYEDHTIATAEVASTLFEQFLINKLLDSLPPEQQLSILQYKIARDIATIQRQVAVFNLELEIHTYIKDNGIITSDELAKCMTKHLKSYLGKGVSITKEDGYSYVAFPHLRYGFYVYTYAFGQLVSNLMLQKFEKDERYLESIKLFLSSGCKNNVEEIFSEVGINTRKQSTFITSLESQKADIALFSKLVASKVNGKV